MDIMQARHIVAELNRLSGTLIGAKSASVNYQGHRVILMPIESVDDIARIIKESADWIDVMNSYFETVDNVIRLNK